MARLRNDAFVGSPISDVDVDQLTFRRVVENAIGDTALAEDLLLDTHSPPASSTSLHAGLQSGIFRGCPLGIPIAQVIYNPRDVDIGPTLSRASEDAYFAVLPFRMPPGEPQLDVVVRTTTRHVTAELRSTSMALLQDVTLFDSGGGRLAGSFTGMTPGDYIFLLRQRARSSDNEVSAIFLGFQRKATEPTMAPGAASSSPFTVRTENFGGALIPAFTDFDEVFTADGRAISSYHLSRLNQQQNTLEEYMTGAPAAGNASLTLEDSADVDPGTVGFHCHAASEGAPNVVLPLWAEPFGGIEPDGQLAGFDATWDPPGLTADENERAQLCHALLYMPLMDGSFGSSLLRVAVIGCSPNNRPLEVQIEVECFDAGGSSAGSAQVGVFAQIGSTLFWRATVSGVEFHPDQLNRLRISCRYTYNPFGTDLRVLGASAWMQE